MLPTRALRAVAVAAAALVTLSLAGSPAQARTAPPDPERVTHAQPAQRAARTLPSTIDSDVYVYTVSPNFRTFFVISGRLRLHLKSGSTTQYVGTLVDYAGSQAYEAKANATDPANPKLRVSGKNGSFQFQMDQYFGGSFYSSVACLVAPAASDKTQTYFSASAHGSSSVSYDLVMSQRTGPLTKQFEYVGTLVLTYDANNRVSGGSVTVSKPDGTPATTQIKQTGYFSSSYTYFQAKVLDRLYGFAGTFSGTYLSGNAFSTAAPNSTWVWSGSPS